MEINVSHDDMPLNVTGLGSTWVGRVDGGNPIDGLENVIGSSASIGECGQIGSNVAALESKGLEAEKRLS